MKFGIEIFLPEIYDLDVFIKFSGIGHIFFLQECK